MKKWFFLLLAVLLPSPIHAQGVPGKRMVFKQQVQYSVGTTATNVTRNVGGYVAILSDSTIEVNAANSTANFFTVPSPGVDLELFYNTAQKIWVKALSGTATVTAIVYDYE